MHIGVIGLGSIGLRHARNARGLGATVTGFDPDEARRTLCAEAGCTVTADENDIFEQCDAVVICSPNRFHLDHLRRAVQAGRHALVEKPLAHTLDGLLPLLDGADARGLVVGAAMNLRFHPVAQAARRLVTDDVCGKPLWARFIMSSYLPAWRPHQDYSQGYTADRDTGGVIFDVIHEPDLACFILGAGDAVAASAYNTGTLNIPTEDCADFVIDHGVCRSAIHVDYVSTHKRRFFEIQCTSGFIQGDLLARRITAHNTDGKITHDESFPGSFDDDYVAEMHAFLTAASGGAQYPCPARDSYDVLRAVLQVRKLAGLPGA